MTSGSRKKVASKGNGKGARKNAYSGDSIALDFLDYFEHRGHRRFPSAPLVPEDPTLLFTAAGMVPFKNYYSDPRTAPHPTATSVQKCLRAGGKQSDLENVGRTLRHHTFFEMLGNFSFGDYFKKEAIDFAWELSTAVWNIDSKRIWISVFQDDDEAAGLWADRIGVPKKRIVRLGKEDNFWGPVGDTGVCGPSSELYYDTGEERSCKKKICQPGCDCDRYIEFWNLVFPQFFFTEAGEYDPLPKPGIDTGMGLERVAFILQDAEDNFHTDLFLPIREAVVATIPAIKADEQTQTAVNVATDHVKALVFAISEGVMPSNEGRGYVLRNLLRRSLTKMHPLGVREPFLNTIVDTVVATMGARYPELQQRASFVRKVIKAEEEGFLSTLEMGLNRFREVVDRTVTGKSKRIAGSDAFLLYDTYGFPLELTSELALESDLAVDEKGFAKAMQAQKERGRSTQKFGVPIDKTFTETVGVTDAVATEFLGYDALQCDAALTFLRADAQGEDVIVDASADQSVFYPEGGGQIGDTGEIRIGGRTATVIGTFRHNNQIVHRMIWGRASTGDIDSGVEAVFKKNKKATLVVDRETRLATARNHTATHLLHASLRAVLGDHVAQAGSLVAPDRLRFDFHHFQPMTDDEVARVQQMVNDAILNDLTVSTETVAYDTAIKSGAMALFGEKYSDNVRVVSVDDFSKELCGGTHLSRTGEIGFFLVTHESAVAAGVRRIEALTGKGALDYVGRLLSERNEIAGVLKVAPDDLARRVTALIDETDELRKRVSEQDGKLAGGQLADALEKAQDIGGVKLVSLQPSAGDLGTVRTLGDQLREKLPDGVGVLFLETDKKSVVLIVVGEKLIEQGRFNAKALAVDIADALGLRGGGKPHMVQIGVGGVDDFKNILAHVKKALKDSK